MNRGIIKVAIQGMIASNKTDKLVDNLSKVLSELNDNVIKGVVNGFPAPESIDVCKYFRENGISFYHIDNINVDYKYSEYELMIHVEYSDITWGNEDILDDYINRPTYAKNYTMYQYNAYRCNNSRTDKFNIPINIKKRNTIYINLDDVNYIK